MPSSSRAPLLICGSGKSLFPDLLAVWAMYSPSQATTIAQLPDYFDIMAVNEAFLALPTVHHLVSYHDELIWPLLLLKGPREVINGEFIVRDRVVTHAQRENKGVKQVWAFEEGGGSSAFFACQIAIALGYSRAILCGVPYDASGKFLQPHWIGGHDYAVTDGWEIWERWRDEGRLNGFRSMSGRTRDLLGNPEREWVWQ